jgi:hypothetical protein
MKTTLGVRWQPECGEPTSLSKDVENDSRDDNMTGVKTRVLGRQDMHTDGDY